MMFLKNFKTFLASSLLLGVTSFSAQAELILDLEPGGTPLPCGTACGNTAGETFGWLFDVSNSLTIDGLGIWDNNADGIGRDAAVGLWRANGELLASTVISNSSTSESSTGNGQWLFEDIKLLVLDPGQYVVGNVFYSSSPTAQINANFNTISDVTFLGGKRSSQTNGGLQFAANNFSLPIFGSNIRTVEVPEPTTLMVFSIALMGMAFRRLKA